MVTQTAPARTRRGRPGHDLESVLQGAVRVFNERGYDGTAMEDLSHELGISKSAIYHHVESKEQLLTLATVSYTHIDVYKRQAKYKRLEQNIYF